MVTATEIWPAGSKYDIKEIREQLEKWASVTLWDELIFSEPNSDNLPNDNWPSLTARQHNNSCLLHGDCRKVLPAIRHRPKFLFADPPFNIGHGYSSYDDNLTEEDYRQFTFEWIRAAVGK